MKKASIFGKYLLLDRLNVGGMAEVFLAKTFGVEGLERYVAIKKILPSMAEDDEFIRMFIDEARICVQLNHANVVHIHDLDRANDSYYIAMEYVAGKDVRTLLERFRKRGQPMPVQQAVFIASRMCEGLHYAHTKKDARGQELGIIHRDVSPQNILVSYEGEVKLIDFGIAKAANRSQKTQAGILKGKFGYMSPEMVRGHPIDRRSDIFAVGVLLYELLTGQKLFTGESDYSVLEKVRNAEVPVPREMNPDIPVGLERVILKALAREPTDRYQWAADLQEDLIRFLLVGDQIFTSKHLAAFMKEEFAQEIAAEAAAMERYATVERPEELSDPGVAAKPAPTADDFGVDEEEDGVDKTQLLDPEVVNSLDFGFPSGGGEDLDEATRFDAVNPFGHDVAPEPERGGRVVVGEGEAYSGATVVGVVPTHPEMPATPAQDTRVFEGQASPNDEGWDTAEHSAESTDPRTAAFRASAEEALEGEEAYAEDGYADEDAGEEPYDEDEAAYDEEAYEDEADGEEPYDDEDAELDPSDDTNSVSGPTRPAPLERLVAVWRQGPKWLPLAAGGVGLLLLVGVVALVAHGRAPATQPLVIRIVRPESAVIRVDGQPVKSGMVSQVEPGTHDVEASAPGFKPAHQRLVVAAGRPPPVVELSLEAVATPPPAQAEPTPPPVAQSAAQPEGNPPEAAAAAPETAAPEPTTYVARFDSEQKGVRITVDGKEVGETPKAELDGLEPQKTYHYTATLAGFRKKDGTFSSEDGSDLRVAVALEKLPGPRPAPVHAPKPVAVRPRPVVTHRSPAHHAAPRKLGRLAASTHPAGAEIYVDNRPTGRHTPVAPGSPVMLPVGPHQVVFKLGKKRSAVQRVEIKEDDTAKLINVPLE